MANAHPLLPVPHLTHYENTHLIGAVFLLISTCTTQRSYTSISEFLLRPSCPKKAEDGSHCLKRMLSKSYKSWTTLVVAFNSNTLLLSKLPNHLGNPELISVFFSTAAGFNFKRLTSQTYKHKDISHISSISFGQLIMSRPRSELPDRFWQNFHYDTKPFGCFSANDPCPRSIIVSGWVSRVFLSRKSVWKLVVPNAGVVWCCKLSNIF